MSKFFIERPIFAWVVAIIVMLVGAIATLNLPVNQYPDISPPADLHLRDLSGRQRRNHAKHGGTGD